MSGDDRKPWVTRWGHDDDSWNIDDPESATEDDDMDSDGTGNPGRSVVGCAVSAWALTHPVAVEATTISAIFNLPVSMAEDTLHHLDLFKPEQLAQAIGTWSYLQGAPTTVAEASLVFHLAAEVIVAEIDAHGGPYLFLAGDRADAAQLIIEHEGE